MSDRADKSNMQSAFSELSADLQDQDENYVVCPYDKVHRILPSRLALHLIRCARNNSSIKLVRCPFNTTHMLKPDELHEHVASCDFRRVYARFKHADMLPPTEPRAPVTDVVESSENWDEEPPVPSYDPQAYCVRNPVIRNIHGGSASQRRDFRNSERIRLNKFK
ncbi:gametocyte-specific factor 1 homolog [Drosophila montana]|uniref:gametocyte-specific factor 1 homolog n=1 Tax=Drosophila montana TaxID=40370 RepID=UPI00313E79E9